MHTSPEMASAYEHLWENKNGLQDKFAAFWKVVATKFNGNSNVIGYDIVDEPWVANLFKDASLTAWAKFDREKLQPMYEKVTAAIREVDEDHIVFFQPAQFPDKLPVMGGIVNPVGFEKMP